jgi:hypothetical protein
MAKAKTLTADDVDVAIHNAADLLDLIFEIEPAVNRMAIDKISDPMDKAKTMVALARAANSAALALMQLSDSYALQSEIEELRKKATITSPSSLG